MPYQSVDAMILCCAAQDGFGGVAGLTWSGFVVVNATDPSSDFFGTQQDGTKACMHVVPM